MISWFACRLNTRMHYHDWSIFIVIIIVIILIIIDSFLIQPACLISEVPTDETGNTINNVTVFLLNNGLLIILVIHNCINCKET
jgi:hypothetical protein